MALERYEMQIHKSEFKPLSFDNSFKLEIASSFNGNTKKHFENILSSIDTRLSDWDERPTLDDIKKRLDVVLVAGGKYHDIDFARLELLKLLAEDERIRTRVYEDYSNLHAISNADFLITYTCDVRPILEQQKVLRDFVANGKRWLALHGTNSILQFLSDGRVDCPRVAPIFMETLVK